MYIIYSNICVLITVADWRGPIRWKLISNLGASFRNSWASQTVNVHIHLFGWQHRCGRSCTLRIRRNYKYKSNHDRAIEWRVLIDNTKQYCCNYFACCFQSIRISWKYARNWSSASIFHLYHWTVFIDI